MHPILQYFEYEHLSGPKRQVSRQFKTVAFALANDLPDGPEKSVALRKLLESKDAAVRAALALED